ncbi:hypothetical protein [Leifsonia sp. Leaf264]|uniref:hypothetical protein n=1 Tax=Leifsonia sp. Leaf264 TaxID=1736314 RepID=UPI0006FB83F2|nr:hypothetical protein [Leifsonia sp. Leaf264]KQO98586.1 hypothetical protein ASF30_11025 [Leifsonia sp. Leaf264]
MSTDTNGTRVRYDVHLFVTGNDGTPVVAIQVDDVTEKPLAEGMTTALIGISVAELRHHPVARAIARPDSYPADAVVVSATVVESTILVEHTSAPKLNAAQIAEDLSYANQAGTWFQYNYPEDPEADFIDIGEYNDEGQIFRTHRATIRIETIDPAAESTPVQITEPAVGMVVTFDDPYDGTDGRFTASFIPGAVSQDGEFIDCVFVDVYGGSWKLDVINANHPEIIVPGIVGAKPTTGSRVGPVDE